MKEIKQACKEVKSGVAGDTIFMYKCYPFICKQLVEINKRLSKVEFKRIKKEPSEWNIFVGEYLRQGKTVQEAAKDWKAKKEARK